MDDSIFPKWSKQYLPFHMHFLQHDFDSLLLKGGGHRNSIYISAVLRLQRKDAMWFLKPSHNRPYSFCLMSLGLSFSKPVQASPGRGLHGEDQTAHTTSPTTWVRHLESGSSSLNQGVPTRCYGNKRQGVSSKFCPNCRLVTHDYYCLKPQRFWKVCYKAIDTWCRHCYVQVRNEHTEMEKG